MTDDLNYKIFCVSLYRFLAKHRTTDRAGRAPTRPFCFSARAGWVGVVLRFMPGRVGGWSIFDRAPGGRRPVFLGFYREPN